MRTTRIALVSLLALSVLSGCASHGPRILVHSPSWLPWARTHMTCGGPVCRVQVSVSAVGDTCEAKVNHDDVFVTTKSQVRFIWTIPGPGRFADRANDPKDGVHPKNRNPQFVNRSHGPKQFQYDFLNTVSDEHKYDVTTELNGVTCITLDPYIIN